MTFVKYNARQYYTLTLILPSLIRSPICLYATNSLIVIFRPINLPTASHSLGSTPNSNVTGIKIFPNTYCGRTIGRWNTNRKSIQLYINNFIFFCEPRMIALRIRPNVPTTILLRLGTQRTTRTPLCWRQSLRLFSIQTGLLYMPRPLRYPRYQSCKILNNINTVIIIAIW